MGVARHPTDAWVARQLREATPCDQRPQYLVRDNDRKYGPAFAGAAEASGIAELRTAYRAPGQNAACERFLGSVRRECLNHLLVPGEGHLRRVLREYAAYFNRARPHQGLQLRVPDALEACVPRPGPGDRVRDPHSGRHASRVRAGRVRAPDELNGQYNGRGSPADARRDELRIRRPHAQSRVLLEQVRDGRRR
jgi:hypothetical protein